jgi:predicted secreted protein
MQITLAANFSTGYAWHVESLDEEIVLHHCSGFVPDLPVMPGSGGAARLFFEAFQPGRTELRLAYYRPWEDPSTATATFTVRLVVH